MRTHAWLLALGAAAACTPRAPQTVTPVRVDTVVMQQPAQQQPAAQGTQRTSIADDPFYPMNRMDWPGPNAYRDASGRPGPAYWQQRADYDIQATLDTGTKTLTGQVTIHYTNNSPDTLHFVWLQLDQNVYRPGSKGSAMNPPDTRNSAGAFAGGYTIQSVTVNGKSDSIHVNDTMGRIDLDSPLAPKGGTVTMVIRYSFPIPVHGSDRMGRDGALYEIAQWYPRMVVYDDVKGWNTDPYMGQGEFYLEYGNITYAVTVPAGYTVAGTGTLQNPNEVLTATERGRLAQAAKSDQVVAIIGADEARAMPTSGTKTWRFRAENVRDVAWAGAPDFRWDATSWNGILCQALYEEPKAGEEWTHAAEYTQYTIRTYSQNFYPYPYPVATAVAGPVAGMEYPMFVMDGYANPQVPGDVFRTNDHELGHQWFPMIVGSNERRYAWMDEGINTYINGFSQERRYGDDPTKWPPPMDNFYNWMRAWSYTMSLGIDAPLMTMPDLLANQQALGNVGYEKPAAVLMTLRDAVVGKAAMDRAFRVYIRRWAFKHPTPGDFFRTIENVTGEDLAWFWRYFFYTTDVLDVGVQGVKTTQVGGQSFATITVFRTTPVVFPVDIRLRLADGTTQDFQLPATIWSQGMKVTPTVMVKGNVVGARLWPDHSAPDFNRSNDTWGTAPADTPVQPWSSGGLTTPIPATPHP